MTFYNSPLFNENILNFSRLEYNTEDLSSSLHVNSIFNYETNLLSLDEDKDEIENLLFMHDENIERYNNVKATIIPLLFLKNAGFFEYT